MHTAAYRDGTAVLKWLIDAGVDVNKQSSMRQYGSAIWLLKKATRISSWILSRRGQT